MPPKTCPKCGAPAATDAAVSRVCAYCGAAMFEPGDERAELEALEQYHALLVKEKDSAEKCSRLIADGFMPASKKALVEAGLRCVPKIDTDLPLDSCKDQWAKRLETIATRLKIAGDEASLRAANEFEAKVKAWKIAEARETKNAIGCFAIAGIGLLLTAWWAIKKIWPG